MRKHVWAFLLFFAIAAMAIGQQADKIPVDSRIQSVTVFSDRAMVERGFNHDFVKGVYQMEVAHLPGGLIDESVRVSGEGTARAKILGVEIKPLYLEQAGQQKVREAEDKYNGICNQLLALDSKTDVLNRQRDFIIAIGEKSAESINKDLPIARPSVAEWGQMVKFIGGNLDSINAELREIADKKAKLADQKIVAASELGKIRSAFNRVEKSALVDLQIEEDGALSMAITYTISGATWTPLYDIRVNSDKKEAELTYMALISQATGEDWANIKLTLSTARPVAMSAIPQLNPSILDVTGTSQIYGRNARPGELGFVDEGVSIKDQMASFGGNAARLSAPMLTQQLMAVNAETSIVSNIGIAATFEIIQKVSIISGNAPQKVTINVLNFKGTMDHYTIPKQSASVYLKTKLCNGSESPLLAGKANVFYDGDFISATAITTVVPTDSFEIFLGVDQAMKIKRELVAKFTDDAGFAGGKMKIAYEYKITVENFRKTDENITVLDQYPVSQNKDIEISLKSVNPPVTPLPDDENRGFLRWVFGMKPTEKKQLQFKYEIKYPKDATIEGLY
jgi:uncharacterized protein (TIGR02231 family)